MTRLGAVAGLILAGGRGSRMGGTVPKPLVSLAGRPMIAHVLERLAGIAPILIAADDPALYGAFEATALPDRLPGYAGPLAGLDAGAAWLCREAPDCSHVAVLPADTPFLPRDIVQTLGTGPLPRVASIGGRLQPAVASWPVAALGGLSRWLQDGRPRAIRAYLDACGFEPVDVSAQPGAPNGDPFFNVNTPDDLLAAEAKLRQQLAAPVEPPHRSS
ncbi:molybdenum cofactor guanylyltransferase [Mangrovicella endophytica]|uniref:molybdenum cofactor guanylyltransferase n=1 Tax=Mangrovicella endophytica TaxID=2066697 RepID=UPI000C9E637E|nr:molybdenum cofactor guanylyltransferase [Mangrovicella endophytica]